jgi:hypothetical protein
VAVVDRPCLPGRRGRIGVGRVARGVRSLLAKDIDEHVKLAGGKANADVVGAPSPITFMTPPFATDALGRACAMPVSRWRSGAASR